MSSTDSKICDAIELVDSSGNMTTLDQIGFTNTLAGVNVTWEQINTLEFVTSAVRLPTTPNEFLINDTFVANDNYLAPTIVSKLSAVPLGNAQLTLKKDTGGAVFEEVDLTQNGVSYTTPAGATTSATWTQVIAGSSNPTLSQVLTAGNSAGSSSIDMSGNQILNCSQITSAGDLILNPVGSIDANGKTLNMSNGEIHNCPLIHSQNNVDIVVEGKGNADVILKTANTNRLAISDTGDWTINGGVGTSGQVLTSAGAGVSPSWTTISSSATTADITDTNTSATYYPTFVDSAGTGKVLRADTTTTPWSINPNTGVFNFANTLSVGGGASSNNTYIGRLTGTNGTNITAVGQNARGANNGGVNGTAVGVNAGYNAMGDRATCIGAFAGNSSTGVGAICIGYNAGGSFSVPNSNIIIDADLATNITASGGTNRFYVNPIRNATQTTTLGYDATTKEITYYTAGAVSNASNVASQIYASDFASVANADYAGYPLFSTITESGSIAQTAYAGRFGVRRFATASANQSASKMVSNTNGSQPNLTLSMISQDTTGLGWTIIFSQNASAGFYQWFAGFFTTATSASVDWTLDYPRAVFWRQWTDTGDWGCKLGNAPTQYFTGSGTASNNFLVGRIVPNATGVTFYLYNQNTSTNYTPITILYSATSGAGLVSSLTGFYYGFQLMNAQAVSSSVFCEVDFMGFQVANQRIY